MEKMGNQSQSYDFFRKFKIKTTLPLVAFAISAGIYYYYRERPEKKNKFLFNLSSKSFSQHKLSLLLAHFNYETQEQVYLYLPALFLSSLFFCRHSSGLKYASLFLYQATVSVLFTYYYQRTYSEVDIHFSIPKNIAGATSLFFVSLYASLRLKQVYGGVVLFPLWIYPVFLGFYEYYSDKMLVEKEVNRKTHLLAILNGFILGIFL